MQRGVATGQPLERIRYGLPAAALRRLLASKPSYCIRSTAAFLVPWLLSLWEKLHSTLFWIRW